MKKKKTSTGALPNSAGFPGTDMVKEQGWMAKMEKEMMAKHLAEAERLFYTADEGSLLDRIWKGEKLFGTDRDKR
jgi:hypothetical protein